MRKDTRNSFTSRSMQIEQMEQREMFATHLTIGPWVPTLPLRHICQPTTELHSNGNLTINGSFCDDKLELRLNKTNPSTLEVVDLRYNKVHSFPASQVNGITAKLNAGNDRITVNDSNGTVGSGRYITILGGSGNDIINGGKTAENIYGHDGDDTIRAGDGNDYVRAGSGDDRIYGDKGNDRLYGDGGKDAIYGGAGHDRMYGGSGNDVLLGQDGNDYLYGEFNNDWLFGGDGVDRLHGGYGNDFLDGGNVWEDGGHDGSADYLNGGSGGDTFMPDWVMKSGSWRNQDRPARFLGSFGDKFSAVSDWPVEINFNSIKCIEETDEVGDDEPYVVFWWANLNSLTPAADGTRTMVFDGNRSMEEGETQHQKTKVFGPSPIENANDMVLLASVVENDNSDPNAVLTAVESAMVAKLATLATSSLTRTQKVNELKAHMNGAIGLGVASGGINMDEFSAAKEISLSHNMLQQVREGNTQALQKNFSFDGGHYRINLSVHRADPMA